MRCNKCGNELSEKARFCEACGAKVINTKKSSNNVRKYPVKNISSYAESKNNFNAGMKEYELEGTRILTNCMQCKMPSHVVCNGNRVAVSTKNGMKKYAKQTFLKSDLETIEFKNCFVWKISYIICMIIMFFLSFITYGLSLLGIVVVMYCMTCRHLVLVLEDGEKILIPINQDADAVPLLREIGYAERKIRSLERKRISHKKWFMRKLLVFIILWIIAFAGISGGLSMRVNGNDTNSDLYSDMSVTEGNEVENYVGSYIDVTTDELERRAVDYYNKAIRISDATFMNFMDQYSVYYGGGGCNIEYEGPIIDENGDPMSRFSTS